MNSKPAQLLVLALTLAGGPVFAQTEMKIVVEPEHPDLNDLITLSVTNTACHSFSEVLQDPERHTISIRVWLFTQQCQNPDPGATDFKSTIGPLEVGDWSVQFVLVSNGVPLGIRDNTSFSVGLPEGGINGLYYNPDADGHYLYVLETDFTTMVVWTTFDPDGNQVWVLGLGEFDGRTLSADAYINRSTGYSGNFELEGFKEEHWGRLEVEMDSCWKGTVSYQSDLPEFGSGQFPIERLAFVKQLGCDDIGQGSELEE